MNAKKAKSLRKAVANFPAKPVDVPPPRYKFYFDLLGNRVTYEVTGTLSYPDDSQRRIYQDAKKAF